MYNFFPLFFWTFQAKINISELFVFKVLKKITAEWWINIPVELSLPTQNILSPDLGRNRLFPLWLPHMLKKNFYTQCRNFGSEYFLSNRLNKIFLESEKFKKSWPLRSQSNNSRKIANKNRDISKKRWNQNDLWIRVCTTIFWT